jgi:hypothetical protein
MSILASIDNDLKDIEKNKVKKRRNKHEREADRVKISQLYLAGESQYAIGKKLNLSQSQVSSELAIVRENWVKQTSMDLDTVKAEQLVKIDKIEQEMWACWEKSKRTKKLSTKFGKMNRENNPAGIPQINSFNVVEEEELGDMKYMDMIMRCVTERLKITGGYAAKEIKTDIKATISTGASDREEIISLLEGLASSAAPNNQNALLPASEEKNYIDAEEIPEEVAEGETNKQTYQLLGETKGFLCMLCNTVTWKPIDFQNRFCPKCNVYHENTDLQVNEEEYTVDPSRLKIYDPTDISETSTNIVAVGMAQEQLIYNKRHDGKLADKLGDMTEMTNFGFKNRGIKR